MVGYNSRDRASREKGGAPGARANRFGAAFWFDWAPMLVLGLVIALTAAWSVAGSVTAGAPAPVVMVQAKVPAPRAIHLPYRTLAEIRSHRRNE